MEESQFQRLHEDLNKLWTEVSALRNDMRNNMIDVAVLKGKVGTIAAISALIASALFSWVGKVFF